MTKDTIYVFLSEFMLLLNCNYTLKILAVKPKKLI